MKAQFLMLALLAVPLFGSRIERTARDAVSYGGDEIGAWKKSHPAADAGKPVAARQTAIDHLTVYCAGPAYLNGGKCSPPKDKYVRKHLGDALKDSVEALSEAISEMESGK